MPTVGSKLQVYHGTAEHTSGGLRKGDLVMNKRGRIVSKKQMSSGKRNFKFLTQAGYKPTKGKFQLFHKNKNGTRRR